MRSRFLKGNIRLHKGTQIPSSRAHCRFFSFSMPGPIMPAPAILAIALFCIEHASHARDQHQ